MLVHKVYCISEAEVFGTTRRRVPLLDEIQVHKWKPRHKTFRVVLDIKQLYKLFCQKIKPRKHAMTKHVWYYMCFGNPR